MRGDEQIGDDAAADQVFLDDALEGRRIAFTVPGALRVDERDRPALADAQAIRLGAQNASLVRQTELRQAFLQKLPRGDTAFPVAALRRRLFGAKKNVSAGDGHADRVGDFELGVSHCQVRPQADLKVGLYVILLSTVDVSCRRRFTSLAVRRVACRTTSAPAPDCEAAPNPEEPTT